jgi:solute carrier family 35, member D1/2/3
MAERPKSNVGIFGLLVAVLMGDPSVVESIAGFGGGALYAAFYAAVSLTANFFNKGVLSVWRFDFPLVILSVQLAVMSVGLYGYLRLSRPEWRWRWDLAQHLFVLAVATAANIGISLYALSSLNVPMYSVLKRMNVALILTAEFLVLSGNPSRKTVMAVAILCVGTIVAGYGDIDFTAGGYGWAMLSCMAQASHMLILQTVGKRELQQSVGTLELIFYNSVLSFPLVLLACVISGDLALISEYQYLGSPGFAVVMVLNIFLGAVLNYATYLSTTRTSALTTAVAGQFKSVIGVIIGFFIVGGARTTPINLLGIIINGIGSAFYSYVKFSERRRNDVEKLPQ